MRILITGGHGFIGRNLVAGLADSYSVMAPTHSQLDLLDDSAVREFLFSHKFDTVIHAATWNATSVSDKDVSLTLDRNLRMFFNLVRHRDCFGRLICFGSGAEFSRHYWHGQMSEEEAGRHIPSDAYGLSKLLITRYCESLSTVLNLRLFGVFGPHEDWRIRFISSNACRGFIDLPLRLKQDRYFDYLHVDDVVSAVKLVLALPTLVGTFNLCRGKGDRLSAIADMILRALGKDLPLDVQMAGDDLEYSGDNRRIKERLPAWSPTDLASGVARQVAWIDENWDAIDPSQLHQM